MRTSAERRADHLQGEINKLSADNERILKQNTELKSMNDTLEQEKVELQAQRQIEKD